MKKESKKNFNLLLTASAFSNLADGIAGFPYPWLFSLITRDPLLISLMTVLVTLPQLIGCSISESRSTRHGWR